MRHKIDLKSLSGVIKLGSFLQRDICFESDHRDTGDGELATTGQPTVTNCLSEPSELTLSRSPVKLSVHPDDDDSNNLQEWLHSEGTEPSLLLSKSEQQQSTVGKIHMSPQMYISLSNFVE